MNPILTTDKLCIHIGNRQICNHVNLEIYPGQVWGILGPNGIGKTTLLHTLAGLRQPKSGTITLFHQNMYSLLPKEIAKKIGVMFQSSEKRLPLSVLEYVTASRFPHLGYFEAADNDHLIIQAALKSVDMFEHQHRKLDELSGGETCRAAIAATLAQTPDIYMLDEPANHLDMHYQLRILRILRDLALQDNKSIVMCMHDINLVQTFCSHVLMMSDSGDMQQGKVSDILSEENLSELYNVQINKILHNGSIVWQCM